MSLCTNVSVAPCLVGRQTEAILSLQCSSQRGVCRAKAGEGVFTLLQHLSLRTSATQKIMNVSFKSRGTLLRSSVIRAATAEDVEAEKEMIEMDAMERMEKTLEATKSNFNTVRTGRASPNLLDRVEVEYYGANVILKSIAQVSTPDGSTILVQPFDKSSLPSIEKALIKSDVGITPSNDGNVI